MTEQKTLNQVIVGDISLSSSKTSMEMLLRMIEKLFKNKDIKEYLDIVKRKSIINNSTYTG